MVSNLRLMQIAGWGGVIVSVTGLYLQTKITDRVRNYDYYRNALKALRTHPGAVNYLGEPIKDYCYKITDPENNSDGIQARFCVPVSGTKERGKYYFWAKRDEDQWFITRAELELKSVADKRLVIVKSGDTES